MPDYVPFDISRWCNANVGILNAEDEPPVGRVSFRGLPFLVGEEGGSRDDDRLVVLGGGTDSVLIPIGGTATYLIVAHRLLETNVPSGGPLGVEVADYVLKYADGGEERVTIRERFEIVALPGPKDIPGVPGSPYRAFTDQKASLLPRYEGEWESVGRRQTEAGNVSPSWWLLWAFRNPAPDRTIEAFQAVSRGQRLAIGAVTASHVDEFPFARQGRRPVRITLTDPDDAAKPFDIDLKVDRGDTTYVHPLPKNDADGFLSDSYIGYGEEQNEQSSPAYAEVSAVPSATVTVAQDGEEIGSVKWGDIEKGSASTPRMRVELVDPGRNWVEVTVIDDDTGRPVPCRVHFRSPEGVPYQPHGHHNQVNSNLGTWHIDVGGDARLGQITYAYIDGRCRGWLPRGEVLVDVARGFEYEPLRTRVSIEPGQRELTLRLKRWTHMNSSGWYSGDSHVHFLGTQGAHAEAQGEDLNVVNLLQSQWGSLFTNTEDFTGEPSVSRTGDSIVYTSQENRQHFMGHMIPVGTQGARDAMVQRRPRRGGDRRHHGDHAQRLGRQGPRPGRLRDQSSLPEPQRGARCAGRDGAARRGGDDQAEPLQPQRVLQVPERRVQASAGRRNGQDVERRARRPLPHIRQAGRHRIHI